MESSGSEARTDATTTRDFETLKVRSVGPIHWLTLNRPDAANAMSPLMASELIEYFSWLGETPSVRAVVLAAAGKHFCAGFDFGAVGAITDASVGPASAMRLQQTYSEIVIRMRRCPQPIIALIHGAASGGGLAVALAADVRYAADDARMNVAMACIGLSGCDMGISYFLPRAVGTSNAAEMMMGGKMIDASKALRIGLVSEVVPRADLESLGASLASQMVAMSPMGLRFTKAGLNAANDAASLESVVELENRAQVMCMTPYMMEGVRAFLEKRAPIYTES
jgi:enoyl-CoA hydratase/carnithine racemase